MENKLNIAFCKYENIVIMGDENADLLKNCSDAKLVRETYDNFDMVNVITDPTCFVKDSKTLIDHLITNRPKSIIKQGTISTGVSDVHKMIYAILPGKIDICSPKTIYYRSYKQFDEQCFREDLYLSDLHSCTEITDVNEGYRKYVKIIQGIIDKHAPIKTKVIKTNQAPYMNSKLRKAIAKKSMLSNKLEKCPSNIARENYRIQRNYVVSLTRTSVNIYFQKECLDGGKGKFWKTIKPFMGSGPKGNSGHNNIVLSENGKFIKKNVERYVMSLMTSLQLLV